ncbi:MAG: hypothetical protein WCG48_00815 [Candidatus Berkelbacteria bacterium]
MSSVANNDKLYDDLGSDNADTRAAAFFALQDGLTGGEDGLRASISDETSGNDEDNPEIEKIRADIGEINNAGPAIVDQDVVPVAEAGPKSEVEKLVSEYNLLFAGSQPEAGDALLQPGAPTNVVRRQAREYASKNEDVTKLSDIRDKIIEHISLIMKSGDDDESARIMDTIVDENLRSEIEGIKHNILHERNLPNIHRELGFGPQGEKMIAEETEAVAPERTIESTLPTIEDVPMVQPFGAPAAPVAQQLVTEPAQEAVVRSSITPEVVQPAPIVPPVVEESFIPVPSLVLDSEIPRSQSALSLNVVENVEEPIVATEPAALVPEPVLPTREVGRSAAVETPVVPVDRGQAFNNVKKELSGMTTGGGDVSLPPDETIKPKE